MAAMDDEHLVQSQSSDDEDVGRFGVDEGSDVVVSRLHVLQHEATPAVAAGPVPAAADLSSLPDWAQRICAETRSFGAVHVDCLASRLEAMLLEQSALTLTRACAMACACRAAVIELHQVILPRVKSFLDLTEIILVTICALEELAEDCPIATVDGLTVPLQLHFPMWDFERGKIEIDYKAMRMYAPWCWLDRNGRRPVGRVAYTFQCQFAELAHVLQPVLDIPAPAYRALSAMEHLCCKVRREREDGARRRVVAGGTTMASPIMVELPRPLDEQATVMVRAFRDALQSTEPSPTLSPEAFVHNPYRLYTASLCASVVTPPPIFMWHADLLGPVSSYDVVYNELPDYLPSSLREHAIKRWDDFDELRGATTALQQLQELLMREPASAAGDASSAMQPLAKPDCPNCGKPIVKGATWRAGGGNFYDDMRFQRENGGRKRQCCSMHCERIWFEREMEARCQEQHSSERDRFLGDCRFYWDCPFCLRRVVQRKGVPQGVQARDA